MATISISQVESVNAANLTPPVSGVNASSKVSAAAAASVSDKVEISSEGAFAANLASQVSGFDSVRPEIVQNFKSQISAYPPPTLIEGLTLLLGQKLSD